MALAAFFLLPLIIWALGAHLWNIAYISPMQGFPGDDPHGRGTEAAIDFLGVGLFVMIFLSAIGAALAVLATFRENWNSEFVITSLAFLLFAGVTLANYMSMDVVFTRDSQAILNVLLVGSAVGVIVLIQKYIAKIKIVSVYVVAVFILFLSAFAFVALPAWYTISFVSWRLNAGELKSLDDIAKAIGGIGSLLAVLGLQWKSGLLQKH